MTAISKSVKNVVATFTWNGTDYPLGSFDTCTMTSAESQTLVFPSDGTGNGVVVISGGSSPDSIELSTTTLEYNLADTLQKFYNSGTRERGQVSLVSTEDPDKYYLMENARVTSTLYQYEIDDTWGSKYTLGFDGRLTIRKEGNM